MLRLVINKTGDWLLGAGIVCLFVMLLLTTFA